MGEHQDRIADYLARDERYQAGGPFPSEYHPDAIDAQLEARDRLEEKGERLARHMLYGKRSGYVTVAPQASPVERHYLHDADDTGRLYVGPTVFFQLDEMGDVK